MAVISVADVSLETYICFIFHLIRSDLGKRQEGRNRNTERETHIVKGQERLKLSQKETKTYRK